MLHENVKLNDSELAEIIKDLSEFSSTNGNDLDGAENSLSRNDEPGDSSDLQHEADQTFYSDQNKQID